MAKTTKKLTRKTATKLPPALKAMENMVTDTDPDVHIKQVTERLNAAGISSDIGYVSFAGRNSDGSGWVNVVIGANI